MHAKQLQLVIVCLRFQKMSHNAYFFFYSLFLGSSIFPNFGKLDPNVAIMINVIIIMILHSLQPALQLVWCTHQSMLMKVTLSPELKVPVPTVGAIQQEIMIWAKYIFIVMVSSLN